MIAMQYEITLPADYDMAIIRRRVAEKGHALDAFPGLGFKAYLIRETGVHGSLVNQYAPFYLWAAPEAMGRFLWEGVGFGGLVASFGRPTVQTWIGVAARRGPMFGEMPSVASRLGGQLPPDIDPTAFISALREEAETRAAAPGLHSVTYAVDPKSWQYVRFTLWRDRPAIEPEEIAYEVLHLSHPGADDMMR